MASATATEEYDCTEKCRSVQHGKLICDIPCKPHASDKEVLCVWKKTCLRYHKVKDEYGRSAIHIAASTGRDKVVEWLVKKDAVDVNGKEGLSGYTPLHRSIFFGHLNVARTLIRLNAALQMSDYEGYNPLDLFLLNKPKMFENMSTVPNEVYVWGSNENYNLGIGTQQPRLVPELMDRAKRLPFEYVGSCITQVCMERYHSMFVHLTGDVYSCGYGSGGRLGLGNEFSAFTPGKVDLGHEQCSKIALGTDHSVFLLSTGEVRSCGSNENAVLGQKNNMSKCCKPKKVDVPTKVIDVAASRLHSVFLTKDAIYVCGLNVGQMCKPADVTRVVKPEKINLPYDIHNRNDQQDEFKGISCTEYATAVTHSGGLIYIMKNYDCIILNARNVGISKIQLIDNNPVSNMGEKILPSENESVLQNKSKLTLYALTTTGRLLVWRDAIGSEQAALAKTSKSSAATIFNFVVFNIGRSLTVRDFAASCGSVILVNNLGEAFKASVSTTPACFPSITSGNSNSLTTKSPNSKATSSKSVDTWNYVVQQSTRRATGKDPFSNMMLETFKIKRIPNIHNGICAFSDPRGKNFAITQVHQKANLIVLPTSLPSEIQANFTGLLQECSMEDNVHDVIFNVKGTLFPAHRYIIGHNCKVLFEHIKKAENFEDEIPSVMLADVEPHVFELILQFIYTNNCDIFIPAKFGYTYDPNDLDRLKSYAKKLSLQDFMKKLKLVEITEGRLSYSGKLSSGRKYKLNSLRELYDVELVGDDGKVVGAHLCVLVARLEYFKNMMFSNFWMEGSRKLRRLNFPGSGPVMEIFLQMIYEDSFTFNRSGTKKDLEIFSQALISTDLLLAHQFRSQLECAMVDCMSIDNVSDIIQLAEVCNASQLKESCMEFVCLNIASLLENRSLDSVPDDLMNLVSEYYRRNFTNVFNRRLRVESSLLPEDFASAEAKYGHFFEELDVIEDADYSVVKKTRSYKIKTKINVTTQNGPSRVPIEALLLLCDSSFTQDEELEMLDICEDDRLAESPVQRQDVQPKPSFTNGTSSKTSTPIAIQPNKSFKKTNYGPIILKASEFPSFEDAISSVEAAKSPPLHSGKSSFKSPSNKSSANVPASHGSAKRRIKWVSLDDAKEKTPDSKPIESSSPRSSSNPWQRMAANSPNDAKDINFKIAFDDIVMHEQRKKENLQKALDKSFQCSQVEEAAMNELRRKYHNADAEAGYETIEVSLASTENEYAIPVWRKLNTNPMDS